MSKPAAIIFDLDGTLLNTLEDIADAANRALEEMGYPVHSYHDFARFIGSGVSYLFKRALPVEAVTDAVVEEAMRRFREYYSQSYAHKSTLYDGMSSCLDELAEVGIRLAVLSNKPDTYMEEIRATYFDAWEWEAFAGAKPEVPIKPDPTSAQAILTAMELDPSTVWYVGDTDVDVYTAKNTGMVPIGAGWGFRGEEELRSAGAEFIAATPMALIRQIETSNAE